MNEELSLAVLKLTNDAEDICNELLIALREKVTEIAVLAGLEKPEPWTNYTMVMTLARMQAEFADKSERSLAEVIHTALGLDDER